MSNFKTRMGWHNAKCAGYRACRDGHPLSANPYRRNVEMGCYSWWDSGWWEAENEIAVEQNRAVREIDGAITLIGENIERQKQFNT